MRNIFIKIVLTMYLCINYSYFVRAQTLIKNGSFEQNDYCPQIPGDIQIAKGWYTNAETPDYFHSCGAGIVSVPRNFQGYRESLHGKAYAGLALFHYSPNQSLRKSYRRHEFIWSRLFSKLEKGSSYRVSFLLSRSDTSYFDSQVISVVLTEYPPTKDQMPMNGQDIVCRIDTIKKKNGWNRMVISFTAQKEYRYISIGLSRKNFKYTVYKANVKNIKSRLYPAKDCYYYVDNIELYKIETNKRPRIE